MTKSLHKTTPLLTLDIYRSLIDSFGTATDIQQNAKSFFKVLRDCGIAETVGYYTFYNDSDFETIIPKKKEFSPKPYLLSLANQKRPQLSRVLRKTKTNKNHIEKLGFAKDLPVYYFLLESGGIILLNSKFDIDKDVCNDMELLFEKFDRYIQQLLINTQLKKEIHFHEKIFETNSIGFAIIIEDLIDQVNPELARMMGYPISYFKNKSFESFIEAEDLNLKMMDRLKDEATSKNNIEFTQRLITKSGKHIDTLISIKSMRDKDKNPYGAFLSIVDITKFNEAKKEVLERGSLMDTIIESSSDEVAMLNLKGKLLFANRIFFENQSNYFKTKIKIGDKLEDKLPSSVKKLMAQNFKDARDGIKSKFEFNVPVSKRNKIRKDLVISFDPVKNHNLNFIGCLVTIKDITDLKKNELVLRERETFLQSIIESSPDEIFMLDIQGEIQLTNSKARKRFKREYNHDIKNGDKYLNLLNPTIKKQMNSPVKESLNGESCEFELENKKLKDKHFNISCNPVRANEKSIIGTLIIRKDISKKKLVENMLKEREVVMESIIEGSDDNILMVDPDDKLLFANFQAMESFKRNFNIDLVEGEKVFSKASKKFRDQYQPLFKRALKGEEINFDFETSGKTSETRHSEVSFRAVKKNSKEVLGCLISAREITKIIRREELIKNREAMLQAVIESSPESILVFDDKLQVLIANTGSKIGFRKNFNIELEKDMPLFDLLDPKLGNEYKNYSKKALKGKMVNFDFESLPDKDGEVKNLIITFAPFRNEFNEIKGIITVTQDVTDLKRTASTLAEREATLDAVLNASPDGIFAIDKNLKVIAINKQAIKDFQSQINVDLKLGDNLKDVVDPKKLKKWSETYFEKVFKNKSFNYQGSIINGDQEIFVDNSYRPVINNLGTIIGCVEISRNITTKVLSQKELVESENKYKSLVETSPTGIAIIDEKGRIDFISKRGAEILKSKVSSLVNTVLFDLNFTKESIVSFQKNIKLKKSKKSPIFKLIYILESEEKIYIDVIIKKIDDKKTNTIKNLIVFNDVTDRIEAEKELVSIQSFYSTMYENMFDPIIVYDFVDEKIIAFNKAALDLLGYKKEELRGKSRFEISPPNSDFYPGIDIHKKMRATNGLKDLEKIGYTTNSIIRTKGGKDCLVEMNIISTERKKGEAFVMIHDQTEIFNANKNLSLINQKIERENTIYATLIANSFDGIDIIEYERTKTGLPKNGKLLVRNDKMKKFYAFSDDLFDSREHFLNFFPQSQSSEDSKNNIINQLELVNLENEKRRVEFRIVHPDGEIFDLESSQSLIDIGDKTIFIKSYRDITDRIKQQTIIESQVDDLNFKNEELKKYIDSNLQLENFAYIASHDLKAPLRTVVSFSELLKKKSYTELNLKSQGYLDIILDSSKNMQNLINDLLTYSRVNTKKMKLIDVDLNKVIQRVTLEINPIILETEAVIEISKELPVVVADESMLIQLFGNLIQNGIKFTAEGTKPKITIGFKNHDLKWEFSVSDNGIGIDPKDISRIFNTFEKLHSNDIYEGTGIGLTICKKIVENHEGRIQVSSVLGQGSTFVFTLSKDLKL